MAVIYVARSAKLGKWASDVGLSKHVFKVGHTDEDAKSVIQRASWAGESDWTLVKQQQAEGRSEADVIARLAAKAKMIDPNFYPKLKGAVGIFKVVPAHVENHIIVSQALAGQEERGERKLQPVDFAVYLIHNALR